MLILHHKKFQKGAVRLLTPNIKLISNNDGTYDLILEYSGKGAEIAEEFDLKKNLKENSKKLWDSILPYAKKVKIKSVKILVSGVLIASVVFSTFIAAFAATDRYTMGYLYSGTDHQQIEYVNQTNGALDVVSPSYFDIREDGSLKLNYLSPFFIKTMHDKGIKVVPFLSNHWNRTAGINALKDVDSLSTQIADYVEEYDLDGVNVDIENVTHEQRNQYTELVRLLREKIPSHKEISVAVAANPKDWQTGWHGSYDYTALAQYADHLLIMAYDEHYEGGDAGPVASIDFVENSVKYALSKTSPEKIVVGIPFYGRVWSLDNSRIVGKGISSKTIQQILESCEATVTYDEETQSVKAEFLVTEDSGHFTVGGDFVLEPGRYEVWFENDQSYQAKLRLIEKYNLKGAGAWALGQEDTSIWDHYENWIDGDNSGDETSTPSIPSEPPTSSETPTPEQPSAPGNGNSSIPEDDGSSVEPPATNEYVDAWIKPGGTNVSVYQNSNLKGKVIASLSGGTAVSAFDTGSGVYQVRLSDGRTGYISSNNLTFEKPSEPSAPQPPSQEYFIYEVQKGDTLWKIAERFLGKGNQYPVIMELNGLTSDRIYAGMQLKIPGKGSANNGDTSESTLREYTVKRGDSLWKIAREQLGSGSRYPEIIELNQLSSDIIYPRQVLKLPAK